MHRTQPNWRIHLAAATIAMGGGLAVKMTPVELAVLALTIGMVLAAEAANSALEAAVDAVGPDVSLHAKHAKDASAAAVLILAAASVVVALILFTPRVLAIL